jgi:RNA polymerase sigma-70 factor (ECF subfamily)
VQLRSIPEDLIQEAQNSPTDFERLYRLLAPQLYGFLYGLLHDHDMVEDTFQEVMMRLVKNLGTLDRWENFGSWILAIAVNTARTMQNRHHRAHLLGGVGAGYGQESEDQMENFIAEPVSPEPPPWSLTENRQVRAHILSALEMLPTRQREAILLFELQELTIEETARLMECSQGAVKYHLHSARKGLAEKLREKGITEEAFR